MVYVNHFQIFKLKYSQINTMGVHPDKLNKAQKWQLQEN
jgi:hypothetical protein